MRLDAACAFATGKSRKEAREAVRHGDVTVNGAVETRETRNVTEEDRIFWNDEALDLRPHVYFMLNKPAGTVCTTDNVPESVLRLFPLRYRRRLFFVGRLDKDTTGLLFLTDDGAFSHRLTSPKHHAEKEYEVTLSLPLSESARRTLESGMTLENGETTQPCRVEIHTPTKVVAVLREGKYHQVKRMFAAVGNRVTALHRAKEGGVSLDPALAPGEFRELTEEELRQLSGAVDKERKV